LPVVSLVGKLRSAGTGPPEEKSHTVSIAAVRTAEIGFEASPLKSPCGDALKGPLAYPLSAKCCRRRSAARNTLPQVLGLGGKE